MEKTNLVGALTAVAFMLSAIAVFSFRLLGKPQFETWIGWFEFALAVPLVWLIIRGISENRPILFFIQIAAILLWLAAEFILDYWLKLDFRHTRGLVIAYVMLFFAGSGGLVGIGANAGGAWKIVSIVLFLIMAALAFIQRRVTGL